MHHVRLYRLASFLTIMACAVTAAHACDPTHTWAERSAFSRKALSDTALDSLVRNWVAQMRSDKQALPEHAKVALIDVSDGYAHGGVVAAGKPAPAPLSEADRAEVEKRATGIVLQALRAQQLEVIEPARVRSMLDKAGVPPGQPLEAKTREAVRKETGAAWLIEVRLRDYAMLTRVDQDSQQDNKGLLCQFLFETVRARMTLSDASDATTFLGEAQGLVRNGFLFMTDGQSDEHVKYDIEYHLDRPGTDPATWTLKPGHGHLGL
jgi:hypothetical protein